MQAHSIQEVEDFVGIASALLVNVGTLTPDWVDSMKLAARTAAAQGKPWVLDPVGCGATPARTQVTGPSSSAGSCRQPRRCGAGAAGGGDGALPTPNSLLLLGLVRRHP